jgi:hypothetical protein
MPTFVEREVSRGQRGGSPTVINLNQIHTSFWYKVKAILRIIEIKTISHISRLVRTEEELSSSVGGFSVDFGGQCRIFAVDRSIQKRRRQV